MHEKFLNLMRIQASLVSNGRASSALGTVIAFDQNNYYVNCELYPADPTDSNSQSIQTGWIPLGSPWVGNGWGFFAPPNIGDIVLIEYQEGSFQNAVASVRFYQLDQNLSVPSGECWLVHSSGSFIKMKNDGSILINSTSIQLGNLNASLGALLNGLAQTVYNGHTHNISGSVTLPPNQLMDSTTLTTNVQAN